MKFLPLLLVPALVAAQDITISQVQYSGNGCPQGTVSTSISSDKTVSLSGLTFTHTFSHPTLPLDPISLPCYSPRIAGIQLTNSDCHTRLRWLPNIHWAWNIYQRPLEELRKLLHPFFVIQFTVPGLH